MPTSTSRPPKPTPTNSPSPDNLAGRIVHDERGNAVWDWLKDTARIAIDSTSRLLRKLEVPELKVEDTQEQELRIESDRDAGGGYDPYGGSGGAASRTGGGGLSNTGSRSNGTPNSSNPISNSRGGVSRGTSGTSTNTGGGYDPYGKGITNKASRKR
jgi:hypothetical protein